MAKLSQKRAAARIGCAQSTLSSYVKRGIAPRHVNLVGVRYFEISDLDAWLASRTVEAGQ
jgi:hypothetical protein